MPIAVHTVVVGGGQAGLAASYHLKSRSIEHILLERGSLGESWRTQRWESFVLNTPNSLSSLPGMPFHPNKANAFESVAAVRSYFGSYAAKYELPVRTGVKVLSVTSDGTRFLVETTTGAWAARSVVIASGGQNVPRLPPYAARLAPGILGLHSAAYRHPEALPPGAVLVVGSAQSGCQIVEELLEAKRTVYLATSRVGRVRRRYRGHDVLEWLRATGLLAQRVADLSDPGEMQAPPPVTTGVGGGHTLSLQSLQRRGCRLLGGLRELDGGTAVCEENSAEHLHYADAFSQRMLQRIDRFIFQGKISAPPREDDPADEPVQAAEGWSEAGRLDLRAEGITSVIWSTGFAGDFAYLKVPGALDEQGHPLHSEGTSPIPGLFYVGLPWLRTRGSGLICGADADAAAITEHCVALYRAS